ncbi:hypothetical protein P5704_028160 (plasmid) [Pseudomonas sp. FeN3W]|nr:hypothetical protein P5704_028160 [Pseudomonas sp. FeN3W]
MDEVSIARRKRIVAKMQAECLGIGLLMDRLEAALQANGQRK